LNTPTPAIYFEDLGLDNLRIYWDKSFANGRFTLIDDNITIASEINDTTITIPQIFGKNHQFYLEIRPQKAEYDNFHNKFSAWGSFCQGISLGLPNWPLYAYNKIDNIIYTSKYNSLVAFDAATLQEINTVSIEGNPWGLLYGGKIASAPHNSTVAAMTGEETWIFSDSRFINPIKISPLPGNIHTRLSALTSDDRFFVVQGGSNTCKIFNALTGEKTVEFSFTYPTIYDIPDLVTVSEDGQFFCASSEKGIEVFEINGTATNLLYTDTRQYKGASFVPSQPDKLLLRVGSDIEIRQMPSFNLIQTLDVSKKGAVLCNIDPASMSLLYYQNDSLKVCKVNNLAETLFKIRSGETTCKMFNNKLLTYGKGGISFNISPYLNH
jgi:WD40 repeat protein